MWLTPTNGLSHASASAFAADTPTSNAPTRPGPTVHATASMRDSSTPPSTIARATTGLSASRCARDAISGTIPPKSACRSIWVETTLETTSLPPITNAAAVSSQLVSIPSTRVDSSTATSPGPVTVLPAIRRGGPRTQALDVMAPHHDGILHVVVVALTDARRDEPEVPVQLLRTGARHPHLERPRHARTTDRLVGESEHQRRGHAAAPSVGMDGDVGDVRLVCGEPEPSMTDDAACGPATSSSCAADDEP